MNCVYSIFLYLGGSLFLYLLYTPPFPPILRQVQFLYLEIHLMNGLSNELVAFKIVNNICMICLSYVSLEITFYEQSFQLDFFSIVRNEHHENCITIEIEMERWGDSILTLDTRSKLRCNGFRVRDFSTIEGQCHKRIIIEWQLSLVDPTLHCLF